MNRALGVPPVTSMCSECKKPYNVSHMDCNGVMVRSTIENSAKSASRSVLISTKCHNDFIVMSFLQPKMTEGKKFLR